MDASAIFSTRLEEFSISPERGFLPAEDPPKQFPQRFSPWSGYATMLERSVQELSQWIAAGCVRREVGRHLSQYSVADTENMRTLFAQTDTRALAWLMRSLSFLGSPSVWGGVGEGISDRIHAYLAVPWNEVARALGRPPIL